jgi:hypothetical protein
MTAAAKPPRPLRLNQRAQLVPAASFARWHEIASATAGLSELDRQILGAIAEHYRRLHVEGFAGSLSFMRLADANDTDSKYIQAAVRHLIELGLSGVQPGGGHRANIYLQLTHYHNRQSLTGPPALLLPRSGGRQPW